MRGDVRSTGLSRNGVSRLQDRFRDWGTRQVGSQKPRQNPNPITVVPPDISTPLLGNTLK